MEKRRPTLPIVIVDIIKLRNQLLAPREKPVLAEISPRGSGDRVYGRVLARSQRFLLAFSVKIMGFRGFFGTFF